MFRLLWCLLFHSKHHRQQMVDELRSIECTKCGVIIFEDGEYDETCKNSTRDWNLF